MPVSCPGGRLSAWVVLVPVAALAVPARGQAPETISLAGILRDFPQDHPDFDVAPPEGLGHCAGNVDLSLGPDGRPVFTGGGYRVTAQWTDAQGRPIAPHLFTPLGIGLGGGFNLVADGRIRARNVSIIDSYDSAAGPYGGSNVGASALVATNSTAPAMIVVDNSSMINGDVLIGPGGDPAVVVDDQGGNGITGTIGNLETVYLLPVITPPALPPYPGSDIYLPINGSLTLSGNWQVGEVRLRRAAVLTIQGDVTLVCNSRFLVEREAQVVVPDGSSLTLYCTTQCRLYGPNSAINPDTSDPSKVVIYVLGADFWNDQLVGNGSGSRVCARVIAPQNRLDLDQSAQFFGTFFGLEVEINNTSGLHFDSREYSGAEVVCGQLMNDQEGTAGAASSGGISSSSTFDEWYRDVLGGNFSRAHTITLVRDDEGIYEYLDDAFWPMDGLGFGNEGYLHNAFFTYAITAAFVYSACDGQFLEFMGTDDAWAFVDGRMAIDLGGVVPGTQQLIEVDRLDLVDGEVYELRFFFAHRQSAQALFHMRTNIPFLGSTLVASVSLPVD